MCVGSNVKRGPGLRASYMTRDFQARSHLLAVRRYAPKKETGAGARSLLIREWIGQVLEEFELEWSMVLGTVTDKSAEVKGAFDNLPGVLRESCIPYMLNHAILDAFGLSPPAASSKNISALGIMTGVKNLVKRVNRSRRAQVGFREEASRGVWKRRLSRLGQSCLHNLTRCSI